MTLELDTHPGLLIIDPEVIVVQTIDNPIEETFTPCLHLKFGQSTIYHEVPAQPYVNGSWGDAEVEAAIEAYLNEINLD